MSGETDILEGLRDLSDEALNEIIATLEEKNKKIQEVIRVFNGNRDKIYHIDDFMRNRKRRMIQEAREKARSKHMAIENMITAAYLGAIR